MNERAAAVEKKRRKAEEADRLEKEKKDWEQKRKEKERLDARIAGKGDQEWGDICAKAQGVDSAQVR